MMDSSYMYDWRMDVDGSTRSEESDSEYEREQLEIALYSQIHFEPNNEAEQFDIMNNNDFDNSFNFHTQGNVKSGYQANKLTADKVLNHDMELKYGPLLCSAPACKASEKRESRSTALDHSLKKTKEHLSPSETSKNVKVTKTFKSHKKKMGQASAQPFAEQLILGSDSDGTDSVISIQDSDEQYMSVSDESGSDDNSDDNSIYGMLGDSDSGDDNIQMNVEGTQSTSNGKIGATTVDLWKINHQDSGVRTGKATKGRYYKPIECFNCSKTGHLSKNCTEPKKQPVCILCAESGHISRACPEKLCFNCQEPGHESSNCPLPRCGLNTVCHRCQMTGHLQGKCPDMWRQFHLTIGPGKIREQTDHKPPTRPDTCFNCGEEGHLGHECDMDRMNRYLCVSTPFICRYETTREFQDIGRRDYLDDTDTQPASKRKRSPSHDLDMEDETRNNNLKQLKDRRKTQGLPEEGTWREMGQIYAKRVKIGNSERYDEGYRNQQSIKTSSRNSAWSEHSSRSGTSSEKRTRSSEDRIGSNKRNSDKSDSSNRSSYQEQSGKKISNISGSNQKGSNSDSSKQSEVTIHKGKQLSPFVIPKGNKSAQLTGRNNFDNLCFTIQHDDVRQKIRGKYDKKTAKANKTSKKNTAGIVDEKGDACEINVDVIDERNQKSSKKKKPKKNKNKKTNQQLDEPVDSGKGTFQSGTKRAERYKEQDFPRGGNRSHTSGRMNDNDHLFQEERDRFTGNREPIPASSSSHFSNLSITVNTNRNQQMNTNLQTHCLFSLRTINKVRSGEFNDDTNVDDNEDVLDVDHQAFQNEWWEKKKPRRRRNKKKPFLQRC